MLAVADAGADDYEDGDDEWIVYTAPYRPDGRQAARSKKPASPRRAPR